MTHNGAATVLEASKGLLLLGGWVEVVIDGQDRDREQRVNNKPDHTIVCCITCIKFMLFACFCVYGMVYI